MVHRLSLSPLMYVYDALLLPRPYPSRLLSVGGWIVEALAQLHFISVVITSFGCEHTQVDASQAKATSRNRVCFGPACALFDQLRHA